MLQGLSPCQLLGTGRKRDFSVSGDFEPIPIRVVMRLRFCASDSDQKRRWQERSKQETKKASPCCYSYLYSYQGYLSIINRREKEPVAVASSDEHYGPSIIRIK